MSQTLPHVLSADIEKDEDDFFVIQCREYPQFASQGKTIEEAVKMLKSLIGFEFQWSDPKIEVLISVNTVSKL